MRGKVTLATIISSLFYSQSVQAADPIDLHPRRASEESESTEAPSISASKISPIHPRIIPNLMGPTYQTTRIPQKQKEPVIDEVPLFRTIDSRMAAYGRAHYAFPSEVNFGLTGSLHFNDESVNFQNIDVLDFMAGIAQDPRREGFEKIDGLITSVDAVQPLSSLTFGGLNPYDFNKVIRFFEPKLQITDDDEKFLAQGEFQGLVHNFADAYTLNVFSNGRTKITARHGSGFDLRMEVMAGTDIDIDWGEGIDFPHPAASQIGTNINHLKLNYEYLYKFSYADGYHFAHTWDNVSVGVGTVYRQFAIDQGHLNFNLGMESNASLVDDLLDPNREGPAWLLDSQIAYDDSTLQRKTIGGNNLYYADIQGTFSAGWFYTAFGVERRNELITQKRNNVVEDQDVFADLTGFTTESDSQNDHSELEYEIDSVKPRGIAIAGVNAFILEPFAAVYNYPNDGWALGSFAKLPHMHIRFMAQDRDDVLVHLEGEFMSPFHDSPHNRDVIENYFRERTVRTLDPLPGKSAQVADLRAQMYSRLEGATMVGETDRIEGRLGMVYSWKNRGHIGAGIHLRYDDKAYGGYGSIGGRFINLFGTGRIINNRNDDSFGFMTEGGIVTSAIPIQGSPFKVKPHWYTMFLVRNVFNDQAPLSNGYMHRPFGNVEGPNVTSVQAAIGAKF